MERIERRLAAVRRDLIATTALILVAWVPTPALAQADSNQESVAEPAAVEGADKNVEDSGAVSDIVVTGTRTGETRLQDTPISITAFTSKDLREKGIEDVRDLVGVTPGLSVSSANNGAQIFIRGVGSDNVFVGSDPSTTIHLDGVYLGRPSMLFAEFLDVQRIEVLRGPQGTLYGRNSAGGTINIVSRLPRAELEAAALAEYGSFDKIRLGGYVSGPIGGDKVLASISFLSNDRKGYVKNINPDTQFRRLNSENIAAVKGTLRLLPSDRVEVLLSADYTRQDDTRSQDKPVLKLPDGTPVVGPQVISDPYTLNTPLTPVNRLDSWGTSGKLTVDITDNIELSSVTAFRGLDTEFQVDNDFTELPGIYGLISEEQEQLSQEIQLTGHQGPLDWIAGVFYFRENHHFTGDINVEFVAAQLGVDEFLSLNNTRLKSRSHAAFAQGTYNVTDRLSITAGARYGKERKHIVGVGTLRIDGVSSPDYAQDQSDSWNSFTPRFVVDYKLTPSAMLYGSVTKGFKSGGFNFTSRAPSFSPENIWAYEAGLKADWLDRRLRTNLSLFYYDYSDLQVIAHIPATAENPSAQNATTNAASARSKGFELEMLARPIEGLELSGGLAYLNAKYKRYMAGFPPNLIDVSGNRLTNSPKWTYNLGAQYTRSLANGSKLSARIDYSWRDKVYFTAFNSPVSSQGSYGLLNGRLSWSTADDHWELAFYGRNLTDEVYYSAITEFSPFGVTKKITEPRTFGVQLNWRL